MYSPSSSYRLKRFTNSHDPDFAAALLVYVRNTPLTIRTDSNEITYWLDAPPTKLGSVFHVFGFYRDRLLVGYAQAAYFKEEQLIALDYISIDEAYRRNNVFYEFADHLKRFLETVHPEYRYAVAEICYGPDDRAPSRDSCLLTRLLKMQGFRVIHAPYYQPRLAQDNPESEVRADLLVYSMPYIEKLRAETFLSVVKALYYKYYLPWKVDADPSATAAYKQHLDMLYAKIDAEVQKRPIIIVNGFQEVLSAPSPMSDHLLHSTVTFAVQGLIVIILLTAAMLGLKAVFKLSNGSFALIYILAISSFVAVAGIVSKEARMVFGQMATVAREFFGRDKSDLKKSEPKEKHTSPHDQDEQ